VKAIEGAKIDLALKLGSFVAQHAPQDDKLLN